MAKKKKSTKKKKDIKQEPSVFWPLTGAVIMMVLALFALLGGFGAGGSLPTGLFKGLYWAFGWAAYFVPFFLAYLGVLKFMDEEHQIPLEKLASSLGFLVLVSCWIQVVTVTQDAAGTLSGGSGGFVGGLIGGITLKAITKVPASIMFFVFSVLALFLAFNISPKVILKLAGMFRSADKDTDLSDIKQGDFKLNENVPVEDSAAEPSRFSKQAAQKAVSQQSRTALTTASDPDWKFPGLDLLNQSQDKANPGNVKANANLIKESLANFNIDVAMEGANVGPRVTQFEFRPAAGTKLTKIKSLEDNLALELAAQTIRIEAPIPGKRAVGVEVPNIKPASVRIFNIFNSPDWQKSDSQLEFAIGKDISGASISAALDKMPHLLVAGQTGSGKSVMINTILTSFLYRNSPSDLKLILIDPKHVELTPYEGIPHLLTPVITDAEKCLSALKWSVAEMERRYKALQEVGKKSIHEYNALKKEEGMPYIVIVIDELSDLMSVAAKDLESYIVRIAQKARAVGIHLILATQRPSVNVITGLIKANIPGRIAFTTQSQVDSRTILDQAGAEKLLGQGDMLLLTSDMPKPKRLQGALITSDESHKIIEFLKSQREPEYDDEVISQTVQINGRGGVVAEMGDGSDDSAYKDAVRVVIESKKASTSFLQRKLRLGYGRAARLIETMEEQGIVSHADGNRPREVLVSSVDEVFNGESSTAPSAPSEDVYDDMPDDDETIA